MPPASSPRRPSCRSTPDLARGRQPRRRSCGSAIRKRILTYWGHEEAWLAGRLRRARAAREASADEETAELTCLRGPAIKKLMADGGPRQLSLFDEQDLAEISCSCCLPASSGSRAHVRQGSPPLRDHTEPAGHDRDRGTSAQPLTGWLQGDRQHGAGTPKQRLGPLILAIRSLLPPN
jgi:hypothetical protein